MASPVSTDVRRRVIAAYEAGLTPTVRATARVFGIGEATVKRLLRRKRETGDVLPKPMGGHRPRQVDLEWLRKHAEAYPDARLRDRIDAWVAAGNGAVSLNSMWKALRAIGWTHKKNSGRQGARHRARPGQA